MEINRETLKGHIDFLILLILDIQDTYGYELCNTLKNKTGFEIKDSTVYVCLKRLESKELIESYRDENDNFGSKRKYYRITEDGKINLKHKINEWRFMENTINKFLNKRG